VKFKTPGRWGLEKGKAVRININEYRKREKKKFDPRIAWVYAMLGMWLQNGNVGKSTFACGLEGEFVE
jgi:hypothetical protein